MNNALYWQMVKSKISIFGAFAIGSSLYVLLMGSIYPTIADNTEDLNRLLEIFPEALLNFIGLEALTNFDQFLSAEYYGLFFLFIAGAFSVWMGVQSLATLVDRGSMAYLLSTRVSRGQIAGTQALVLLTGLFLFLAFNFLAGYLAGQWFMEDANSLDVSSFLSINVGGFLLFFAISGYAFLISAVMNDERRALGVAGGLTFLFYALDVAGRLAPDMEWLRHLSLFSLYRPAELASTTGDFWGPFLILTAIGVALFAGAISIFRHRNLPL
ncbi:ABC transporter permease subunit [Marinococcus sp. PL1-022]|uniref:ABC transporter permease subunit n=1 Tax=Marinococcus sp. PL1-022 TaxID=3095363 RepID=UPI0029C59DDC|nr:ABC transporter permease subunit [Marinococcus sp. PL1-022]MDX6154536.1 ABC transporter permease subunit [Marinococcus sp. PL1-022]